MQPEKMTQSGAAAESTTMDAVPVREAGMTTAAQRGAAYYNSGLHRELDLPRMGAGRRVDILGGLHRSPTDPGADLLGLGVLRPAAATNDPGPVNYNSGTYAQQPGLGGGRNEDLLGVFRRADAEDLGAVLSDPGEESDLERKKSPKIDRGKMGISPQNRQTREKLGLQ